MSYKKLIFVSGKGGVGKSTISLILARMLHQQGKRVLLVEMGERSSAEHLAELKGVSGYLPQATPLGFQWVRLTGLDCLTDYVGSYVKVEKIAKSFFDNPLIKTLINLAPGLEDLAILGKLTSGIRHHGPAYNFDHIIIDAHSTGSFTSMLRAPRALANMVSMGPLHSQSENIDKVLFDGEHAQYFFVSLLEDLPLEELLESVDEFRRDFKVKPTVVLNKVLPELTRVQEGTPWAAFILNLKHKQQARVGPLTSQFPEAKAQGFIAEPLAQYLQNKKGDDLRTLFKNS
ncbi:MAG: AAA family ATPase [Bdellovibrionales bacterium]|nr:AAA family ATPase [Bdellovibrionales bacterium]